MQTKKKTTNRRSTAKKTTSSKTKRSQSPKTKSPIKKGKVSLSPTKVIWLCCAVIAICLALLLVTSVGDKKKTSAITKRFEKVENESKAPVQKEEKIANTEQSGKKSDEKPAQGEKKSDAKSKSQKENEAEKNIQSENKSGTKSNTQTENQTAPKKSAQSDTKTKTETPSVTVAPSESELLAKKQSEKKETAPKKSAFNFPAAVNHAELVFVFDDGGQNLNHLQPFLELPIPITVAVLPKLAHSAETAARVRKSGNEVILHQPMQAINSAVNPGPGAIKPEMTALEIDELVQSNIDEIAPISGMNNHEGSLITADAAKIGVVLDAAERNGIFFLDSRTNVETKVPEVCKKYGYGWYERNGRFLDNEKTREEFLTELRKNLDIANKSGSVIMIAHIWSADYLPDLIKEVYPELKEKGYTFTTVSGSSARKF